jgi:hypothetical protein
MTHSLLFKPQGGFQSFDGEFQRDGLKLLSSRCEFVAAFDDGKVIGNVVRSPLPHQHQQH